MLLPDYLIDLLRPQLFGKWDHCVKVMIGKVFYQMPEIRQLAQILKRKREHLGLSHAQVHTQTRIPQKMLEAFDNGDFAGMEDDFYLQSFLAQYASVLELEPEKILALYRREQGRASEPVDSEAVSTKGQVIRLLAQSAALRVATFGIVVTLVLIVILSQGARALQPPDLAITYPSRLDAGFSGELVATGNSIRLEGIARGAATVALNGQLLSLDTGGEFSSDEIAITSDQLTLTLIATSNLGRSSTINLNVVKPAVATVRFAELDAVITVRNSPVDLLIRSDGVIKSNQQFFVGDVISVQASNLLEIDTDLPANLELRINDQQFSVRSLKTTWRLVDGNVVEQTAD